MDAAEKERPHHNRFTQTLTRLINQPKFELHLKVFDLNNVPLVSGHSFIKWHLANSMHAEQRGRTSRCPILNHRVDYNFSKVVPSIRIPVDRNLNLAECNIEFEVMQEFSTAAAGLRDERVPLGVVRLNLSEFVEESDALTSRKRSASLSGGGNLSASTTAGPMGPPPLPKTCGGEDVVEDGIVRRYLMQESKINSTLKVSILMVQTDGERNYVAPPLRTAPVFGGISGFMPGAEQTEQDDTGRTPPCPPSLYTQLTQPRRLPPQHPKVPRRRRAPGPLPQRPDGDLVRPARGAPRLRRGREPLLRRQRLGPLPLHLPLLPALPQGRDPIPRRRRHQRKPLGRRGLRRDAAAVGL
ncbi:N-terminal C2 domain-containing protein [Candidatus Bathyarchaeota archaeon]|nr:N-terminal C2 domain-containing protein [Candidatus Bathyarchaeota archaeon]